MSVSRTLRLRKVLHSYVPKQFLIEDKLRVTSFDGTKWGDIERNTFDRVSRCRVIVFIQNTIGSQCLDEWCAYSKIDMFRYLLTSRAPQTDTQSWRTTTIYSIRAGLRRDDGCRNCSWSCWCKLLLVQFTLQLEVNRIIFYKMNKLSVYPAGRELKLHVQAGRSFTPRAHFLKFRMWVWWNRPSAWLRRTTASTFRSVRCPLWSSVNHWLTQVEHNWYQGSTLKRSNNWPPDY